MKRLCFICGAFLLLAACDGKDPSSNESKTITVDFSIDKATAYTGEAVKFTPTVQGGVSPYTYAWDFSDGITSAEESPEVTWTAAGVKVVTLSVTDSEGNSARQPKSKTFAVTEAPIEDKGDIKLVWYVDFNEDAGSVRASAPAIDDDGNVYIETSPSGAGTLRKVSSDGKTTSSVAINAAPKYSAMSPSIDAQGNIYAGGGSGGGGSLHKYSSSLADTWSGKFWNSNGGDASPKMWYGAAVVLDDYVLVGNAGTTGTMGALSKADGSRYSYVTNAEGTSGPSGGCRQSPVVSNDGYVWQVCAAKGIFGISLNTLLSPGAHPYEWFNSNVVNDADNASDDVILTVTGSDRPAHAVVNIDGENWLAGFGTPEGENTHVYIVSKDGKQAKQFVIDGANTSIANSVAQDQGGVIVGVNNELIVNLKNSSVADGGIVAVNPKTMTLAWEYRVAEYVACTPALTKEGNVVFGTDKGSFYIIKPNGNSAELVAKADITALLTEAGISRNEAYENFNIRMWSSVTIGDDGKMYIGFTKENDPSSSGLLCIESTAVTGPGTSCWPMFGVDRKHTGVQK